MVRIWDVLNTNCIKDESTKFYNEFTIKNNPSPMCLAGRNGRGYSSLSIQKLLVANFDIGRIQIKVVMNLQIFVQLLGFKMKRITSLDLVVQLVKVFMMEKLLVLIHYVLFHLLIYQEKLPLRGLYAIM